MSDTVLDRVVRCVRTALEAYDPNVRVPPAALLWTDEGAQWAKIAEELREVRRTFGKDSPGGARRTSFEDAPEVEEVSYEAMIEREPVTVVCSEMGWIRAMRGHLAPDAELKFKDGDRPRFFLHAETTDRLLLFASNGRMYTLLCASLPGGRGTGEPVRLMIDLPNEAQMVSLFVHVPGGRLIVWCYAREGNFLTRAFVEPLRRVFLRRASRRTVNAISVALTALLYPIVHTLYRLPLRSLPYHEYFRNFRALTFRRNVLNVFDKLNAPQTQFISRARIEGWFDPAEFTDVSITPYRGVSWCASGTVR